MTWGKNAAGRALLRLIANDGPSAKTRNQSAGTLARWATAALGFCTFLSACATTPEPVIKTVEVFRPTPVYCRANVPEREYPDTQAALKAAPGAEDRYLLLAAGRKLRIAVENELRVALKGCRGPNG